MLLLQMGGTGIDVGTFFGYVRSFLTALGVWGVLSTTVTAMMILAVVAFIIRLLARG